MVFSEVESAICTPIVRSMIFLYDIDVCLLSEFLFEFEFKFECVCVCVCVCVCCVCVCVFMPVHNTSLTFALQWMSHENWDCLNFIPLTKFLAKAIMYRVQLLF